MRVTILGCGSSTGTPAPGMSVDAVDLKNPRNWRLRASILVEEREVSLLIDTGPDLRQQMLNCDIQRLDAVLYTHGHADHLHGIDDLRCLNQANQSAITAYADAVTWATIRERFGYVLEPLDPPANYYYKPVIEPREIAAGERFQIGQTDILAFDQDHGYSRTLGFRIGNFAYSTDVVNMPAESLALLEGVEIWVVDALSESAHPTHSHVEKTLAWIEQVRPRRAVLTHMSAYVDYDSLAAKLPTGVEVGYDGMVLELA
jgi:phosphoribosyl 1,2-cyclic phosphate phosphodiesterase